MSGSLFFVWGLLGPWKRARF